MHYHKMHLLGFDSQEPKITSFVSVRDVVGKRKKTKLNSEQIQLDMLANLHHIEWS
jgi:hypothetical protein